MAEIAQDRDDIAGTGAELLARTLKASGVSRVFALCGDHINALYRALDVSGIEIISVRQESAAVHMADGWARATGEPGVAVVTGAPGHTNAITGLAVAHDIGAPVLLISGATPLDLRERGGLQALAQGDITRPVTKFMHEVMAPDHYGEFCVRGLQIAMADTPGPVNIGAPLDTLTGQIQAGQDTRTPQYDSAVAQTPSCLVDGSDLEKATNLLAAAERPVLILGSGAFFEYTESEIAAVVRDMELPVFTVDLARGLVPDDGDVCFGYADPFLSTTFREACDADLVILVGAQADAHLCLGRLHVFGRGAKFIQMHRDSHKIGMNRGNAVAFAGRVKPLLNHLSSSGLQGPKKQRREWLQRFRDAYHSEVSSWTGMVSQAEQEEPDVGIHPLRVCMSLARHYTDRTVVTVDAGDFIHWPRSYFPARSRGHWMDGSTYGALGAGLPLGLGAQIAFPNDPVWVFLGDGGFGFYSWELSTAVEYELPVKIIIGNDSAWGIEKRLQLKDYGKAVGCELPDVRYDKFAELVGAQGFHVRDQDQLDATVDAFVAAEGPAVLDVRIRQLAGRPFSFAR